MKICSLLLQSLFALMLCTGAGHASRYLYIGDDQGNLGTVDVTTGSVHVIRNMGHIMTDIAFDPVGNLYGITFTDLYSIDKNTGISTWIGSLGINDANALVFSPDGTLYTSGWVRSQLYKVNTNTGAVTGAGTIGKGTTSDGDLEFNGGNLYLTGMNNNLIQMDLTNTTNSADIGLMGFNNVFGLATGDNGVLYGATTTSKIIAFNTSTGAGSVILDYSGHGLSGAWGASTLPKVLPHAAFTSATFYGPASYLSSRDSPFFGTKFSYFYLEDFEDGSLNTPGVTASSGWSVISGNNDVDSVDADDGVIDGKGNTGKSFFSNFVSNRLTFTFNAAALGGNLPTHAGIVWTDANASANRRQVEFSALDSSGTSLGSIGPFELGDNVINGTTAEDRFLGVYNPSGISSITISMPGSNNWEVDHLQYGSVIGKQEAVPYPDLTAIQPRIQPRLHLTATALGITADSDSSPLKLPDVPRNVEIDVSFKGYVTEENNSSFYSKPNYRYHWIIDGEAQSSETQSSNELTKRLPPTPKNKPHNVVLKAEKLDDMRTAQSTPPVYSHPVMLEASMQVPINENTKWVCMGRLGKWCYDGVYKNNLTTWIELKQGCNKGGQEQICINSEMSVGAILHDKCCSKNSDGLGCRGNYVPDRTTSGCEKEWGQAITDKLYGHFFKHTWIYPPDGTDPPSDAGQPHIN